MNITEHQLAQLRAYQTPFYYYDMELLDATLTSLISASKKYGYDVHYALKANSNPAILEKVSSYDLGADCVSGNEISRALETGFSNDQVVFAGVGKTDREIQIALENDIHCFNCESIQELEVINELAAKVNTTARIAIRINPNIEANTHKHITTGLEENKFGIGLRELDTALDCISSSSHLRLIGIHFHVGSQITDLSVFRELSLTVNKVVDQLTEQNISLEHVNLGGGLGVNYDQPDVDPIPDFESYFKTVHDALNIDSSIKVFFELGRSIVAQCGNLLTQVLFTKDGRNSKFAIVDAGMTELLRPALYESSHKIDALTYQNDTLAPYHIVGPICETTDSFAKDIRLKTIGRGDVLVINSAGAYGEAMRNNYNLRDTSMSYFSDQLGK